MTPILRKGDKVHFSVPIVSSNGRNLSVDDIVNADRAAKEIAATFTSCGVSVVGWGTNSAITAVQVNFVIREEPDA